MSRVQVRMVGGSHHVDGREEIWDTKYGDIMRVPKHPDFVTCGPDCPEQDKAGMHYEEYRVHRMQFDSGHEHWYAAELGVPLVQVLNRMWHEYRTKNAPPDKGEA